MNRTPYDLAMDCLLSNCCDSATQELIIQTFGRPDKLDDRRFTKIHEIVLGRTGGNLARVLHSDSGLTINQRDSQGRTPLSWAAARGDIDVVKLLMNFGADVNLTTYAAAGPLSYAIGNRRLSVVKYLLDHGADIEQRCTRFQHTPLLHACNQVVEDEECVRLLIKAGANVNALRFNASTPLILASMRNATRTMAMIMERSVDINHRGAQGYAAIHSAIQENSHQAIKLLLSSEANIAISNKDGSLILHLAATRGDLETLRILTRANIRGFDIDHKDSTGTTPLQYAELRTEEPPEWHIAFSNLLASVGVAVSVEMERSSRNQATLWRFIPRLLVIVRQALLQDTQQIYRYLVYLPRPPIATLRVFAVLLLAWYVFNVNVMKW